MSLSRSGYIGLYLFCSGAKTKMISTGDQQCSGDAEHEIPDYAVVNYCNVCGSPVVQKRESYVLSYDDLFDIGFNRITKQQQNNLNSKLYQFHTEHNNITCLIPTDLGIVGDEYDNNTSNVIEFDWTGRISSIDTVTGLLKAEINLLKQHIFNNVEVKFGYISNALS